MEGLMSRHFHDCTGQGIAVPGLPSRLQASSSQPRSGSAVIAVSPGQPHGWYAPVLTNMTT